MCTAVFAPKIALLTSPAAFSAGMESQGDKRRAGQGTRARAEKDQLAERKAERRALIEREGLQTLSSLFI